MERYSTFKIGTFSFLILTLACLLFNASAVKAQETVAFDYIKMRAGTYYAVLELPNREYIVIGTRSILRKDIGIQRMFGRAGQIELLVNHPNDRQEWIRCRIMDNGRNATFYSQSSARQFVRKLTE